ncbi:Spindle and centriole-associated protein 1 [Bagarius yarrelli]|uniref:Spindle and centriole-associated protein 1 n=1 Tax=Bagarius yarrelli TaxID=175774 RepID=A0A556TWP0_BAGYA|nr:Spindle and centriole-associated protein 1 [Bagarius yarrelli]
MSFVRVNRRPVRTKKVSVPKKEWVSTVHDLSVHRSTAEELSRRHDVHRSRNRAAAQWELREKSLKKRRPRETSPPGLDQTRMRLFREDVLARSDRALAVVRDLFGDAPHRQKGFPNVTMAPDCESDSELPVLQKPDPPTQLSLLSQSVMDQQALNEVDDFAAERGNDLRDVSVSFNSETCRLKRKTCKSKASVWGTAQQPQQQQNVPQTPCNTASSEGHAALNATVAVQRLKSRQSQSDSDQSSALINQVLNPETSPSNSGGKSRSFKITKGGSPEASGFSFQSANQSSLELLQNMLAQVETELDCLVPMELFGPSERPELQRGRGLTGFSVALVGTLGRIVSHLRRVRKRRHSTEILILHHFAKCVMNLISQRDEEAKQEAQVRLRMEEEMKEQRSLIDALTAECLTLREETAALKVNLQERIPELEQRVDMVILAMGELEKDRHTQSEEEKGANKALQVVPAEKDQEEPAAPISPAVLLSPPHQRESRAPPTAHGRSLNFESTCTPGSGSPGESESSRTPSSFASLPETVLPRPAPLLNQLSQHAMLEQIAELTLQNAAIRAQLEHNHSLPNTQCSDRGVAPVPGPPPTKQCVDVDDSSVRLMEDRLQELNRQSAAARAKLLELIEQQRQTTSHSTSPSVSPIPLHSTSPHTVIGRQTPEVCVSVPERASSSHSRTNSRRSAEAITPQNFEERQKQSVNTQVDNLKGEGWFALSAHVRKLD